MAGRRLVGGCGLFFWMMACGGTVSGGDPSPREQLQATGAERCHAACNTMIACGALASSCACSCECPAGTDCACPPCNCGPTTVTECAAECTDSVNKTLHESLKCDGLMLALLDCLGAAACEAGTRPCREQESVFESCMDLQVTPPTGGPVVPGAVTCQGASGAGLASGGVPPSPGDLICENGWDACSDGRRYSIECRATATSTLECSCIVNGIPERSFTAAECVGAGGSNTPCGWNLQ